mgnify:CR=1 FL=1
MEKVKKGIDYSKSKIYKIVCDTTGLVYIGSTVETLSKRLTKHKASYNYYLKGKKTYVTSFDIIKNDNYKIILIENCPCNSKEELHREERKYIESIECVNKYIPGRTRKEYCQINKNKIKEQNKEYREINKDKIKEQTKEYRENNKHKIKEIKKKYYQNSKDKILEKNKIKIECEFCKSLVRKSHLKRHQKTLKCLKFQTIQI